MCVFGCGGDRDRGKRPEMGAVAAGLADVVVLTSRQPAFARTRWRSSSEVRAGADGHGASWSSSLTGPRPSGLAVGLARPGDVVLVAGKGHETTQDIGGRHRALRRPGRGGAALAARFGAVRRRRGR